MTTKLKGVADKPDSFETTGVRNLQLSCKTCDVSVRAESRSVRKLKGIQK